MEKEYIDLFEFQTRLKEGVESLFPKRLWLKAEISAIKARNGGHCYLELSQSNDSGLIAKASAAIWSSRYRFLAPYFESVTGSPLQEGMSILVEVQPSYSQLYGFTLVINDIDPEFSLGIKELERQRTIERLQKEGLMGLQKELLFPYLPYRFAVISAEDAAGSPAFSGGTRFFCFLCQQKDEKVHGAKNRCHTDLPCGTGDPHHGDRKWIPL